MRSLREIRLQNYRSFVDAKVNLSPFTLVLGANGAGKTNFLRAFVDSNFFLQRALGGLVRGENTLPWQPLPPHFNQQNANGRIDFVTNDGAQIQVTKRPTMEEAPQSGLIVLFRLDSRRISAREIVVGGSFVAPDGAGTTQCLESLKNGDEEAMFDAAETALKSYVPEIEKLSFRTSEAGKKEMQVRERGISRPILASELSEGTRLIIALLAIIYQHKKPPVICLEDIDRGMHPRVFEQFVKLMQRIAREREIHIIASTHNPYLVDCFQDDPESVVIVEKKDGVSTLSTLADKLKTLDYDKDVAAEMPLGNLWFSGFVGGVPEFLRPGRK